VNNRCPDAADNVVTESPGVALGHGNQFSRPPSRGNWIRCHPHAQQARSPASRC
jgi:hypothetical protein